MDSLSIEEKVFLRYITSVLQFWDISKKFRTGPFEQTPQDLKRAARARHQKRSFGFILERARHVLGLEGSIQKVLFKIS